MNTDIPKYNLLEAYELDWKNINDIFSNISWETDEKDENILTNKFIEIVEDAVKSSMEARSREKRTCDENGNKFLSKTSYQNQ